MQPVAPVSRIDGRSIAVVIPSAGSSARLGLQRLRPFRRRDGGEPLPAQAHACSMRTGDPAAPAARGSSGDAPLSRQPSLLAAPPAGGCVVLRGPGDSGSDPVPRRAALGRAHVRARALEEAGAVASQSSPDGFARRPNQGPGIRAVPGRRLPVAAGSAGRRNPTPTTQAAERPSVLRFMSPKGPPCPTPLPRPPIAGAATPTTGRSRPASSARTIASSSSRDRFSR